MKTLKSILLSLIIIVSMQYAIAGDDKYTEAMQKNIKAIYEARDIAAFQQAINAFDRIASTEKTRWEPFYYIGFGYIMMANQEIEGGKKDLYLDKALESIEKAKTLTPEESEVVALEAFAYMIKVTVDPQSRGMVYAPLAMQNIEKSIQLNPENPRAYALKAQMEFGTAKFFNSPTTEACASNARALEKFETYKSANPLAPEWGKNMAMGLTEACK